jgi:hypothetical protein
MRYKDKMTWWRYALLLSLMVLILVPMLAFYFGQNNTFTGTVTFFYNIQSKNSPVYVVAVLDDGRTVHARAPDKFEFRKGHKILLNERTTLLGGKSYQFLAYLN